MERQNSRRSMNWAFFYSFFISSFQSLKSFIGFHPFGVRYKGVQKYMGVEKFRLIKWFVLSTFWRESFISEFGIWFHCKILASLTSACKSSSVDLRELISSRSNEMLDRCSLQTRCCSLNSSCIPLVVSSRIWTSCWYLIDNYILFFASFFHFHFSMEENSECAGIMHQNLSVLYLQNQDMEGLKSFISHQAL